MEKDYRGSQFDKDWWDEEVLMGITRREIPVIGVVLVLIVVFFDMNWDWVFGLRP